MHPYQEQQSKLLSVGDLASILGIKIKTIYAKVESGKIPYYRVGRLVRFRSDEIDNWLAGCKNS